jgi:hypothetical protein
MFEGWAVAADVVGADWPDAASDPALVRADGFDPATGLPWMPEQLGWLCGSLTERLEWLLTRTPSADTQVALEAIGQEPMDVAQRMLFAAGWDRQISAVTARAMAAQLAATRPAAAGPYVNPDLLDDELALVLRRSDRAMAHALAFARRLTEALPATFTLLDAGEITVTHARAMHELTETLSVEQAQLVDASVAHRGADTTAPAFRRLIRRAVADLDPDPADRHQRAKRASGARLFPEPDGMCTLAIRMPATDGVAALTALNTAADARKVSDDPRTHGQRQVQSLLDALLGTPASTSAESSPATDPTAATRRPDVDRATKCRPGRRTEIRVTIDWASLLGLREHPGHLDGYGPIAAAVVRAMLEHEGTTLRRLVYDDVTGVLLDYGTARYQPDAHLRGLLEARDLTCRYPGCQRDAIYCDTEHCDAWDDGGTTSCANCGLMCRTHHNRKTHDGFIYRRVDPATGETVWTTPLGFTYRQKPATYAPTGTDTGDTIREIPPDSPDPPPWIYQPLPDDPPF